MATSPYENLGQIRVAIVNDAKEASSAALVLQINRWINEGYEQVILRKKRDWLDTQLVTQLSSAVQTVCSVVNGSQTVTFETGTIFVSGRELQFYNTGFSEIYNVASTTLNVVTLSNPYLGPTNTAVTGVVMQPHIILPSNVRSLFQAYHQWANAPLTEVGPQQMREIQERLGPDLDYARYCTLFGQDSSGNRRLVLYPYPNTAYTLYTDINTYIIPLAADSDEPVIPMQWRQILFHFGLYKLWSYHRNDPKAAEALNNFNMMLSKIDGEARAELDFPQIQVRYPRGRRRTFFPTFDKRLRD